MRVIGSLRELSSIRSSLFITIGFFDGFHRGHLYLLKKLIATAHKQQAKTLLISFDEIKPRANSRNSKLSKKQIYPTGSKFDILKFLGVDYVLLLAFDEVKYTSYRSFLDELFKYSNIKGIVASDKLSFGYQRRGTITKIEEYFYKRNALAKIVHSLKISQNISKFKSNSLKLKFPPVDTKTAISSSYVRGLLSEGKIYQANQKLLLPFHLAAVVEKGKRWGRKIGFPTVNFPYPEKAVVIPTASYVTLTEINKKVYYSMSYVGIPMEKNIRVVETYLFNFSNSVYNYKVKVYFLTRLEDKQNVKNLGELEQLLLRLKRKSESYFISRNAFIEKKLHLIHLIGKN